MSAAQQLIPVPFYGDTVVLVDSNNEPFVSMKPIVINMGLSWQGQHEKLVEKFGATIKEILTVAEDGKQRSMTCLPLKKLPAWLYSISPNKVKPELREKIVRYQNECDDALWDYWTKGSATRPGAQPVNQRIAMSRHRLALGKELLRTRDAGMRQMIHQQLDEVSRAMGLPTPALDSIGWAEPEVPDIVAEFWEFYDQINGEKELYNHSCNPARIAFNLPEIAMAAKAHNYDLDLTALRPALRLSRQPRFIEANKAVHSRIDRSEHGGTRTVRCWVFARPSADAV